MRFVQADGRVVDNAVEERRTAMRSLVRVVEMAEPSLGGDQGMGQSCLEHPISLCAMCWVTESSGHQHIGACPPHVALEFTAQPPKRLRPWEPARVSFELPRALVPAPGGSHWGDAGGARGTLGEAMSDILHSNLHSCHSAAGACAPFTA